MSRIAACLFWFLASSSTVWAATTWYTVEVLAFQRLSADGLYGENWPDVPGDPAVNKSVRLTGAGEISLDDEAQGTSSSYAYQLLGSGSHRLTGVANRLRSSADYRPLLHIAWSQPGYSKSSARAVHVHSALPNRFRNAETASGGVDGKPELRGTIRVSRARYLHVDADLVHFRRPPADSEVNATQFRMRQSRRLRSKEVHYIDHPLFGLIVLITPHEVEEVFTEEEDETSSQDTTSE